MSRLILVALAEQENMRTMADYIYTSLNISHGGIPWRVDKLSVLVTDEVKLFRLSQ